MTELNLLRTDDTGLRLFGNDDFPFLSFWFAISSTRVFPSPFLFNPLRFEHRTFEFPCFVHWFG